MGLYDNVYVDFAVASACDLTCKSCGQHVRQFQTKSLESCMEDYYLTLNKDKNICLQKMDEPHDKAFWHEYTKKEIEEMRAKESTAKNNLVKSLNDMWISHGGYWEKEAFLPENRVCRSMGELPHQICTFYTSCPDCSDRPSQVRDFDSWVEFELKFTDGLVVSIVRKTHERNLS